MEYVPVVYNFTRLWSLYPNTVNISLLIMFNKRAIQSFHYFSILCLNLKGPRKCLSRSFESSSLGYPRLSCSNPIEHNPRARRDSAIFSNHFQQMQATNPTLFQKQELSFKTQARLQWPMLQQFHQNTGRRQRLQNWKQTQKARILSIPRSGG